MVDSLLIDARQVSFAYPPLLDDRPAESVFADLSLTLHAGECLALMGANGAGKTTLCRLVTALAPQMTGGTLQGDLRVLGQDVSQLTPALMAGKIGVTFQEVEHQLFNATVETEVAWGLEALGRSPAEMHERIAWALEVVGLDVDWTRSPAALSGGQQRRLALAVALAVRPQLLVLDEPLSGLDPAGAQEVLAALAALRRESTAAILMTESNPEAVLALADRLAVLHAGRITLEGAPRTVFQQVDTLDKMDVATPQLARLAEMLGRRQNTHYAFITVDEAAEALSSAPVVSPPVPTPQPVVGDNPAAIRLEGLSFTYPDGPAALQSVDLGIPAGQYVALVGANGSGKTTLAKHLIGLLRPDHGQLWIAGRDTAKLSVGQLARQVGFLFQHPERQIFASSVHDEVAFGPRNLGLDDAEVENRVAAALERFGLSRLDSTPPAVLSYALRRLVTLASVAAMHAEIVVLDEPTVGLDAPGRRATLEWCEELHAAGKTVFIVTHDMAAAVRAERIVVLEAGRVLADGQPAEIFARESLLEQAALVPPPVVQLAARLHLPPTVLSIGALADCVAPTHSGS